MSDGPFWNYRVMSLKTGEAVLCEVYYHEDGTISGYTNPLVVGNDIDDLIGTLTKMREVAQRSAGGKGVLIEAEVEAMFNEPKEEGYGSTE